MVLGRERERPGRPPARARPPRRRPAPRFPLVGGRLHQGRHPAAGPAGSGCAPGTSPPRPAWPRGCPTARRSRWVAWPRSRRPSRRCARSVSGSSACATTATPPGWRSSPLRWTRSWRAGTRSSPPSAPRGSRFVALDLEGFRSGSLNRVLAAGGRQRGGAVSQVRVKVKLTFPESEVRRAVLATMVRQFDVEPNIRRADVEEHRGWIVCEIDGAGRPGRGRARLAPRARASRWTCWGTSSKADSLPWSPPPGRASRGPDG